jgi:hypothetical protein
LSLHEATESFMRCLSASDRTWRVRALCLPVTLFLVAPAPCPLRACVVGDPSAAAKLVITESPPDCCYGDWAGSLHGTVSNVDTQQAIVAVYARTDIYYVQPVVGASVEISCAGTFGTATHGGAHYAAIVAQRGWRPPAQLLTLPQVGGKVLAVVSAPEAQREIHFAGHTWVVKSSGAVPFGPGPNLWSDAADAVWVDALGRLHLRITQRDGAWYSAEVFSKEYVGHGRYRFEVEGALHALDLNGVFSGFLYSDQGDEIDIEFSRWGDANRSSNAQFVVQPDAMHGWLVPVADRHTLQLDWFADRVDFRAWPQEAGELREPAAVWTYTGAVPTPDVERMRFNLWLYGGVPVDGNAFEVVVSSFAVDAPTDVGRRSPARIALEVQQVSRWRVAYVIDLPQAGLTELGVFDPRGRLVERLAPAYRPAGRSHGVWQPDATAAASGVYFLRAQNGGQYGVARFILLR